MSGLRYPIEMVKGVPVVVAPQEIDAHNADCLRAVLLQAAARGHATFVVDMTGTQFCASAGLSVLVRAHKRALADGGELRLVIPASAAVLRVFARTGTGTSTCRRAPPRAPQAPTGNTHPRGLAAARCRRRNQPGLTLTLHLPRGTAVLVAANSGAAAVLLWL